MNRIQSRQYEMLQRVHTFGNLHRDLFTAESSGGQAFQVVDASVRELARHAASKMTALRGGKLAKSTARSELIIRLTEIVRSARAISRSEPGFGDPFQTPAPRSDQALITAGRVFVAAAEEVKGRFIEYGMPDEFVTSLRRVVDEFEEAVKARQAGKDGTTLARASIERALASGLEAVRTLDVIVANRLKSAPAVLELWRSDRRIDSIRRPKRLTTPVATSASPEKGASTSIATRALEGVDERTPAKEVA